MLESQSVMKSMCLALSHLRADRKENERKAKGGGSKEKMERLLGEITVNSAG